MTNASPATTSPATIATLIGSPGCGSAVIEMALALTGLPHVVEDLPYLEPGAGRDRLLALNPTGKVPVLLLPPVATGGAPVVMTESAAMILHLADMAGPAGARLAPEPSSPHRPAFLRWLLFLVAEIYPNITIAEHADHLAVPADTIAAFQAAMAARRDDLWRMMAAEAGSPWFLGERFSAIDLYLAVMSGWAGGRARFAATVPELGRIADAARGVPQVAAVLARHGDPDEVTDDADAAPGTTSGETA